ncbi:lipoate-protein ligase B, partial [Pseudomonas syringae pv. actinidiae ICMP 19096]
MANALGFRDLGLIDYETAWHAMQRFTYGRGREAGDEVWLVQHP